MNRGVFQENLEDVEEFLGRIVIEVEKPIETAPEAGVRIDKVLHLLRVTGDDDRDPFALVVHPLEERVHSLLTKVLPAFLGT